MSSAQPYRPSHLLPAFEDARVGDAMHPGVMSCLPDAPLVTVAEIMATHHVHAVVVGGISSDAAHGDRLVWGLISDMDLIRAAESGLEGRVAADVVRAEAVTVDASVSLRAAARLMNEHRTSHLIVTAGMRPAGIISSLDIVSTIAWART